MNRAYVVPGNPRLVAMLAANDAIVYITCETAAGAQALVTTILDNVKRAEVVA